MVVLALMCMGLGAQTPADNFKAALLYNRISFSYRISEGTFRGEGKIVLQGNCFRMEANGLEVVSDGKSVWTLDRKSKEAVIENVVKTAWDKVDAHNIELVPVDDSSFKTLSLKLSDGTHPKVVEAVIYLPDDTRIKVAVSNMQYLPKVGVRNFAVMTDTLSQDFVITDLR